MTLSLRKLLALLIVLMALFSNTLATPEDPSRETTATSSATTQADTKLDNAMPGAASAGATTAAPTPVATAAPTTASPATEAPKPETITVSLSVDARNVFENPKAEQKGKDIVQALIDSGRATKNGTFSSMHRVTLKKGATVFDALKTAGLFMSYKGAGATLYVSSIMGLAEFDGGPGSGWMYLVNGTPPMVSAGAYELHDGDVLKWRYTIDLGQDIYN